jgi:hypothetical protein
MKPCLRPRKVLTFAAKTRSEMAQSADEPFAQEFIKAFGLKDVVGCKAYTKNHKYHF